MDKILTIIFTIEELKQELSDFAVWLKYHADWPDVPIERKVDIYLRSISPDNHYKSRIYNEDRKYWETPDGIR